MKQINEIGTTYRFTPYEDEKRFKRGVWKNKAICQISISQLFVSNNSKFSIKTNKNNINK